MLIGLTLLLSTDYLGLGLDMIDNTLNGQSVYWYDFLMKSVFTSITLAFGGSGGIVTPIFFVGATAGALFGQTLGLDPATFAAIGLVAVTAGSANTPIAASILGVELFGPKIAPYATVACVISFLMTGHRSVYPSQVLAIRKSESLVVELGGEMVDSETQLALRGDSITRAAVKLVQKFRHMGRRPRKDNQSK
jgi:H+/Cl- antiporter ClcA